ncbi:MAG: hypothetical protein GY778_23865, partial [bacterium]|nr:hypothetical protein [bacterium]
RGRRGWPRPRRTGAEEEAGEQGSRESRRAAHKNLVMKEEPGSMIKGKDRMWRGIGSLAMLILVTALMLVTAVPVSAEEVVEGNVDGFDGDCDGPGTACNAGSGFVGVFGWALATTGVQRVEILIESVQFPGTVTNLGRAVYGLLRPDVTAVNPGYPDSDAPGWAYNINSTLFANGSFTYMPGPGYVGPDTFTYEITDGFSTDDAVVTLNVVAG